MFNRQTRSATVALTAAFLLAGCVSFGAKPPEQLLALSATQTVAPGRLLTGAQGPSLTVADPEAPKTLDTVRVPVKLSPTSIAYVTKVQWADTPRHLFQKLLAETIAATSNRIVLDPGQYAGDAGQRPDGYDVHMNSLNTSIRKSSASYPRTSLSLSSKLIYSRSAAEG